MNILELFLTGISLALDAFTISICKGLANNKKKDGIIIPFFFGLFQFIMPILGYYIGNIFSEKIIYFNPYISMILLVTIGILMLTEKNDNDISTNLKMSELFFLAIATSIDALVIGISFSFLKIHILSSSILIGIITFIMCLLGYYLGNFFNKKIGKYSNLIGGIIIILLGIKIFLQTLFN